MNIKSILRTLSVIILVFAFCKASSQKTQTAANLIPFVSGLKNPVCITNAGDSRIFAVNQEGIINIVDTSGTIVAEPFLDIQDRVKYGGEKGLLGIAFHPQYESNGFLYVNYIGNSDSTYISRFKVSSADKDIADPQSEYNLMKIQQPYPNHNGGDLCFGPDGYLYIGLGDGGSGGDPDNRAQNPLVLLGKMLRIDVDGDLPYSIPATNPFYNNASVLAEIWALGLRNPWRFSFDRETGDLWIADVGQTAAEEINFQPAAGKGGENYGWRCYEGNLAYNTTNCISIDSLTFPVYTFSHDNDDCSVTGGYVYRGDESSPYFGYYFFADYCSDHIRTLHYESGNWVMEDFGRFPGNNFGAFGEDYLGNLYVAGHKSGTLFRILPNQTNIGDNSISKNIRIIQTPFSSQIRIETRNTGQKLINLMIYDAKGSILYNRNIRQSNYDIDPGFLAAGIYFLRVGIDGKYLIHKIIVGN